MFARNDYVCCDNYLDSRYHGMNVDVSDNCTTSVLEEGENARFVIPLFINGKRCVGLRDTGCFAKLLVAKHLLSDADYIHVKFVDVRGVFDVQSHKLHVSKVSVQSPHFQCNESVMTEAAVCQQLPCNIDCIVGNALFSEFSQLHDVINLRQQSGSDLITDGDRNAALDTDIDLATGTVDLTDTHSATDTGQVCSSQNSETVEMIDVTADSTQLTEPADGMSMSEFCLYFRQRES